MAGLGYQIRTTALAITAALTLPACDRAGEKANLEKPKAEPALTLPVAGAELSKADYKEYVVGEKKTLGGLLGIGFTSAADALKSPCAYGFIVRVDELRHKTTYDTLTTGAANLQFGDKVVVFPDCMALVNKLGNSRTLNSSDYAAGLSSLVEARKDQYIAAANKEQHKQDVKEGKAFEQKHFKQYGFINVKQDQTLIEIAGNILKRNGISFAEQTTAIAVRSRLVDAILALNDMESPKDLKAGQRLKVPTSLRITNVDEFLRDFSTGGL